MLPIIREEVTSAVVLVPRGLMIPPMPTQGPSWASAPGLRLVNMAAERQKLAVYEAGWQHGAVLVA